METKFTKGPWDAVLGTRKDGTGSELLVIRGDQKRIVAKITPLNKVDEQDEPNAFLISASPELFSELVAYHDREWRMGHEGIPAHSAGERPEECGACAAISKATGNKP